MALHDVHRDMNSFYDDHVRLGAERRKKLASQRDACLARLKTGLKLLGEKRGATYRSYQRSIGQGSYAMHTLNQHANDEYDIDEAVVFLGDDLPTTALEARKRVADALLEAGGNFQLEPEARTNAVTVWYADGSHVDLAVYREVSDGILGLGTKLEHAGADWGARDPMAITDWFNGKVDDLSPGFLATVREQQLRRVVRWVKAFARSRASWSLPGGMILSALVVEVYRPDWQRDDVALYNTLVALKTRLAISTDVNNPVDGSLSLTSKPECKAQVKRLAKKLNKMLATLAVLEKTDCTREKALRAWGTFFNHEFWGNAVEAEELPADVTKAGVARLQLAVGVAHAEGGRTTPYSIDNGPIPKKRWIHFIVPDTWRSVPGATYKWTVNNSGDEATDADDLTHDKIAGPETWRTTKYKGVHTMTCEIIQNNQLVARGVRRVQVARW
jgi:Adenylyl/Guanylyl and SMODS C-terminal sensor domain